MYSDLEFLNFTTAVNSTFFFSHAVYGNEGTKYRSRWFCGEFEEGKKNEFNNKLLENNTLWQSRNMKAHSIEESQIQAFPTESDILTVQSPLTSPKFCSNEAADTQESNPLKLSIEFSRSSVSLINIGDKKPIGILSTI